MKNAESFLADELDLTKLTPIQLSGTFRAMNKYAAAYREEALIESNETQSKVTPEILAIALEATHVILNKTVVDKIVDLVHLIESKGDDASLMDIAKLKTKWRNE